MLTLHTRATPLLGPRSHLQMRKGGVNWLGPGPSCPWDVQMYGFAPSQAGGQ